jgi:flagellar protein FlaI
MNTLSPEMLAYFWILLENKSNILISGGTASGKTTLLNALAFFIPPEARVVSLEETREINLPRENWLPSVARTSIGVGKIGEIDLFEILKSSFRQNPDYLIVGEVRGQEAFVLFQGMASGHSSLSTIHAESVETLIRRLETPPISLSPTLINSLDCVAIAIHARVRGQETRKIREVVEIVNIDKDGTALVNTPFMWDPKRDIFFFKKQSKVFEKISTMTGISIEKLQKDLVIRARLLYELYKRKIFGFDEVGRIINEYYKNPSEVLARFSIRSD